MNARERGTLVFGLIVLGCLQSLVALVELTTIGPMKLALAPRVGALVGSPNGLGMLLVSTSVLTAREVDRRGGSWPAAALVLQGCALVATGSRTALLVAVVLLIVYLMKQAGRLRGLLAAIGFSAAATVMIWRTATERHQDRPDLWLASLQRIADNPLLGEGPAPAPFTPAAPGARITTHAHNEILPWGLEYGLVGIGVALVVILSAFRAVRRPAGGDRWFQCAALALLAAGMTDFTLRITALTLTAAALTTLALTGFGLHTSPAADLPATGDMFTAK
jgi:O-antigen ligase